MSNLLRVEHNNQEIVLTVENEQLGNFVSSLLGQPQSIDKVFTIPFDANHNYFTHLIELIKQRLDQQNNYELVSFQATIGYKDNTRRKLNTIEAFKTFSESLSLISTDLNFKFGILIHFPNKQIPEKQEIDINFSTSTNEKRYYARSIFDLALRNKEYTSGIIAVELNHTERTWADDMLAIIENSFNEIWIKESNLKKITRSIFSFIRLDSSFFTMIFATLFMIVLLVNIGEHESLQNVKYLDTLEKAPKDMNTLHQKIDFVANNLTTNSNILNSSLIKDFGVFVGITVLFFAFIYIVQEFINPSKSFVVLTNRTVEYKTEILNSHKNKIWALSIVGTIVLSIIANYIYSFIVAI